MQRRLLSGGPHAGLGVGNIRNTRERVAELAEASIAAPAFLRQPATVAIIGAPQNRGQPYIGTDRGPALLRRAGVREMLASLGWRVDDRGDCDMGGPVEAGWPKNAAAVEAGSRSLFEAAKRAHADGCLVLALGGDHSIALGSVAAAIASRPETRILWVDAHADCNTPETSRSGNMHGMPLGYLLGLDGSMGWLPRLDPRHLAFVGLRDVDPEERKTLRRLRDDGAFVSTMKEVDGLGIGGVMREALEALGFFRGGHHDEKSNKNSPPLHLSFDIDAIDPQIAPATGTVVRGGLSFREAHYVCEAVWETGALGSMDIVEVNDGLTDAAQAQETVDLAAALVVSACGDVIC
ncbi:hypothetical protein CTAYLR_006101 [Chrysophaeum taylorii]|uniref:Arginase n=1 Tax=Chrysophaeum taylorii TaxID=2483200 RepID=A0AAD7XIL6_9STRA|nr:hypothetical protein CTAYLR_006101 [Chrysophaeum taylorii]